MDTPTAVTYNDCLLWLQSHLQEPVKVVAISVTGTIIASMRGTLAYGEDQSKLMAETLENELADTQSAFKTAVLRQYQNEMFCFTLQDEEGNDVSKVVLSEDLFQSGYTSHNNSQLSLVFANYIIGIYDKTF